MYNRQELTPHLAPFFHHLFEVPPPCRAILWNTPFSQKPIDSQPGWHLPRWFQVFGITAPSELLESLIAPQNFGASWVEVHVVTCAAPFPFRRFVTVIFAGGRICWHRARGW